MKYIKQFEELENHQIWKIPTKDKEEYIVALDKIGMPEKEISNWLRVIKPGEFDFVLIHLRYRFDWSWSNITATDFMGNKLIDSENYQGEVQVTPEDFELYDIKKTANKYNL